MDRFEKVFLGILSIVFGILLIALGWGVYQLMKGPWEGTGKVIDKSYSASHLSYCGKNCWYMEPACYRLTVREYNGDEHTGCVKQYVWDDITVGQTKTFTKETAR